MLAGVAAFFRGAVNGGAQAEIVVGTVVEKVGFVRQDTRGI
jgi:hypothetical protein